MSRVLIIGCGGHAQVLADALQASGTEIIAFAGATGGDERDGLMGLPVLSEPVALERFLGTDVEIAIGVGSVKDASRRKEIFERLVAMGWKMAQVIHPTAWISRSARLEDGVQVMAGAVVQTGAELHRGVLINTAASVDHHCVVGAHSHVACGARLSGSVTIGENCHIGVGASIIQGVSLAAGMVVGAGAVVISSYSEPAVLVGVPARRAKGTGNG